MVRDLTKDWKGAMMEGELETLQYEVSLTGVREDICIVLNTKIAKYGRLNLEQMYDAVRTHEAYRSHKKCLEGLSPYTGQQQQQHPRTQCASQGLGYNPQSQKTTAFAANLEKPEFSLKESETEPQEEGTPAEAKPASEDLSRVYLPDFLAGLLDAHMGLNVRIACTIQGDEQLRKCCFACQSPDHFIRNCPQAKNVKGPLKLRGPPKNKSAPTAAKAKVQSTSPALPAQPTP